MLNRWSEVYKPMQFPWAEELRQQHEKIHWVPDEVDLTTDTEQWKTTLTIEEKEFIKAILSIFTQSVVEATMVVASQADVMEEVAVVK